MSYIKNYSNWLRLFEQATVAPAVTASPGVVTTEKSKYGEYTFNQLFPDNMITPKPESYASVIQRMGADLKKALSEGRKLTDIKINVESSASSQRPTTNVPKGYTKLDHNYGGGQPSNEFLAKNRGINMKNVIVQELSKLGIQVPAENINAVPRPDGKWVATSEDESEQYVKVKIEGLFEKNPPPPPPPKKPEYEYSIIYSWYQVGESDKKYVLVNNPLSYKSNYSSDELKYRKLDHGTVKNSDEFRAAVQDSPEDITIAGYGYTAPEGVEFFAFGELSNYEIVKGNIFYYADEESWKKDVLTINKLNPTQWEVKAGTLQKPGEKLPFTVHAKGNWNLGKGAQANFEHGTGNFSRSIYTLKPKGDELKKDKKGKEYYSEIKIKQWSGSTEEPTREPDNTREAK